MKYIQDEDERTVLIAVDKKLMVLLSWLAG